MPKVSIIVPVYNTEKYLAKCLDSIIMQTLEEIEIICIDDGSTDDSSRILDRYAVADARIKVIHGCNKGYGAAMNIGLDMAEGDYIGIVESDDCIEAGMYDELYQAAEADDLDMVKSDAYYWLDTIGYRKRIFRKQLEPYYDRVLYDIDRNVFFDFFMNIWTGIYKRQFLEKYGIRFNESRGASYQDNGFWMQTLFYCGKAKWLNRAFYLYRQDNLSASVKSKDKILAMTREYECLEQLLLERQDYDFLAYCYYYRLFRHQGTFYRIADEYKREFCEQIKKDYSKYKHFVKGNMYMDKWLHEISTVPDEVCGKVIQKKKRIQEQLDCAVQCIIYGAGNSGDLVLRGMYNEGYYDKICCFAVSERPSDEMFGGKPLMTIDKACKKYPDALVIVAVTRGSDMYNQMVANLEGLGIKEFMAGSDIQEVFYIL